MEIIKVRKIYIAMADDHTLLRKTVISMLAVDEDIEVVADAANGKELIRKIAATKPLPDICLLDIHMPEMDGYETLVALKTKYPEMKFLILSQLDHEFVIIRMLKAGAHGYLLKDVEPAELKRAIREIINHTFYHTKLVNTHLSSFIQEGRPAPTLSLSAREQEFLRLSCSELAYKEIAAEMNISNRTVAFYRQSLFDKLGVKSRTGLALYAIRFGLASSA